jgi:hypothetical protein
MSSILYIPKSYFNKPLWSLTELRKQSDISNLVQPNRWITSQLNLLKLTFENLSRIL